MKPRAPRCVECGKGLPKHKEPVDYRENDTSPIVFIIRYGIHGNGLFCGHTCGFKWAVRWARRLMPWR